MPIGVAAATTERYAPEGPLEVADRGHRHRVDHLLVELRVALGRREAVLGQEERVVQVDRLVELLARRVVVDDLEVFADGTGLQRLPVDSVDDRIDVGRGALVG